MGFNSSGAELLARSVDKPALFAGLYERHGLAVRRYVVRRIGDGAGDDVASEVFIRAFHARGRYRAERDAALTWLLGIANNVIADHRRLERRRLRALERLTRDAPGMVEHHDMELAPELVAGRRRGGRRLRLPFGTRSIALMPTALLVTVRKLATVDARGVGPVQAWIADTEQHGTCWDLRGPGGWLTLAMDNRSAGTIPGCAPTRKQEVLAQGGSPVGLAPVSADYLSNSVRNPSGQSWDIYYGTVTANGAAAVQDQSTGKTARLIDGQYFILVERQTTNCDGCNNIRAIDSARRALPANYGPVRYRTP